jgi:hypothetical protein
MIIMKIERYCHTNLDLKQFEQWPELPETPQIGSYIISNTGLRLQVVGITYEQRTELTMNIRIELHLGRQFENITEFEKWYNKREVQFKWRSY